MRASTQALRDLLGSNAVLRCNLFTLRLKTGHEFRFTDADVAIVWNGNTYQHDGPEFEGARMRQTRGFEVDTQNIRVYVKPEHQLLGVPWLLAVRSGALDGAEMVIHKAFLRQWNEAPQAIEWFRGEVTDSGHSDQTVQLKLESDSSKFDQVLPRNLFSPGCVHDLFSSGCGLSRAAYQVAGAVNAASTLGRLFTTLAQPGGWFTLGYLIFTSGANAGVSRSIRSHAQAGGMLELSAPLAFSPSIGDSFVIYPGCDKAKTTCESAKFNNLVHFKAMPFVPKPETVT